MTYESLLLYSINNPIYLIENLGDEDDDLERVLNNW